MLVLRTSSLTSSLRSTPPMSFRIHSNGCCKKQVNTEYLLSTGLGHTTYTQTTTKISKHDEKGGGTEASQTEAVKSRGGGAERGQGARGRGRGRQGLHTTKCLDQWDLQTLRISVRICSGRLVLINMLVLFTCNGNALAL